MALTTFRDAIRSVCPTWLQNGTAGKLMYAMAAQADALGDSLAAAVKIRFPGYYSNESLPVLGRERRIRRGLTEADATYGSRLNRWLDDHRRRGGPFGVLPQLLAHFAPNTFAIALVYFSGRVFDQDALGGITWRDIVWSPDGDAAKWARWWLFYQWPESVGPDGSWGDGAVYGDGGVWGSDLTIAEAVDLRTVPKEWNGAHCLGGQIVLLEGGKELWGYPDGTWGEPDGVWGSPAQIGVG
jgi:hypothetical protein